MSHPFQESLDNIEKRLEELTHAVTKKQERIFDKVIIDNDEFQKLFKIYIVSICNCWNFISHIWIFVII